VSTELKISQTQEVSIKRNHTLTCLDQLPCLSPITQFIQMPSMMHEELFGMDLLVSSGDHVESYLSYALKHVPLQIEEI
jgi:hypothetical protein